MSSRKMYSNNIVNFQESTTILNACTKKKKMSGNLLKAPHIYIYILVNYRRNNRSFSLFNISRKNVISYYLGECKNCISISFFVHYHRQHNFSSLSDDTEAHTQKKNMEKWLKLILIYTVNARITLCLCVFSLSDSLSLSLSLSLSIYIYIYI